MSAVTSALQRACELVLRKARPKVVDRERQRLGYFAVDSHTMVFGGQVWNGAVVAVVDGVPSCDETIEGQQLASELSCIMSETSLALIVCRTTCLDTSCLMGGSLFKGFSLE